ncbi:MAG: class I SAM-dependent methyltransferase [Candidatus Lutacidiplasmatales archaeon]
MRKSAFGRDPEAYDHARLRYPPRIYEILTSRCGLRPGAVVLEIGPGTGIATRELLRRGANPITLIEPDRRLVRYLVSSLGPGGVRAQTSVVPFERAKLPAGHFDLAVAATSFHWLPERLALRKVARALKPGGWWASWNNHYGDSYRPSQFHRAIQPLYRKLAGGSTAWPYAKAFAMKERTKRLRGLESVRQFDRISREDVRWKVSLNTARVRALWGTFSEIITLPPRRREWFLTELGRIGDEQFDGTITFPMVTPIYTARRI